MAERLISLIAILLIPASFVGTIFLGLVVFDDGYSDTNEQLAVFAVPLVVVIIFILSWIATGDPLSFFKFWRDMIRGGFV